MDDAAQDEPYAAQPWSEPLPSSPSVRPNWEARRWWPCPPLATARSRRQRPSAPGARLRKSAGAARAGLSAYCRPQARSPAEGRSRVAACWRTVATPGEHADRRLVVGPGCKRCSSAGRAKQEARYRKAQRDCLRAAGSVRAVLGLGNNREDRQHHQRCEDTTDYANKHQEAEAMLLCSPAVLPKGERR